MASRCRSAHVEADGQQDGLAGALLHRDATVDRAVAEPLAVAVHAVVLYAPLGAVTVIIMKN